MWHAELDERRSHAPSRSLTGYSGWYWAVTLARAPRSKSVTVDEVVLLPGADALLAPEWVPWQERLQPGDLSPGDILPADPDDPRLVPAYAFSDTDPRSDDRQVKDVGLELGLGRVRVMSRDGRLDAADRWQTGDFGPKAPMAKQAPAHCGTCGFLLTLAGSLSAGFGVCGNDITDTDGRVVSVEYGCGAHSEVKVSVPPLAEPSGTVYDDGDDLRLAAVADESQAFVRPSAGAAASIERPAEQADDPAGEARPEPDVSGGREPDLVVVAEPAVERRQHDERDEERAVPTATTRRLFICTAGGCTSSRSSGMLRSVAVRAPTVDRRGWR